MIVTDVNSEEVELRTPSTQLGEKSLANRRTTA